MTPSTFTQLIHALTFTFISQLLVTPLGAQGFSTYGQNSRSFENNPENWSIEISQDLGTNVYLIDNLADQMLYRLVWDLKNSSQSQVGDALLKQMRRHAELTNEMINAYRGKSKTSFHQTAVAVNNSMKSLLELNRHAKSSELINQMIDQSIPLISFVNQHATPNPADAQT